MNHGIDRSVLGEPERYTQPKTPQTFNFTDFLTLPTF